MAATAKRARAPATVRLRGAYAGAQHRRAHVHLRAWLARRTRCGDRRRQRHHQSRTLHLVQPLAGLSTRVSRGTGLRLHPSGRPGRRGRISAGRACRRCAGHPSPAVGAVGWRALHGAVFRAGILRQPPARHRYRLRAAPARRRPAGRTQRRAGHDLADLAVRLPHSQRKRLSGAVGGLSGRHAVADPAAAHARHQRLGVCAFQRRTDGTKRIG